MQDTSEAGLRANSIHLPANWKFTTKGYDAAQMGFTYSKIILNIPLKNILHCSLVKY